MNGIEALPYKVPGFQTASSTAFYWSGMVGAIANGQALARTGARELLD
ncbi:MAG TPA: hypothetical protein VF300_04695 [Methanothrix sp.]